MQIIRSNFLTSRKGEFSQDHLHPVTSPTIVPPDIQVDRTKCADFLAVLLAVAAALQQIAVEQQLCLHLPHRLILLPDTDAILANLPIDQDSLAGKTGLTYIPSILKGFNPSALPPRPWILYQ